MTDTAGRGSEGSQPAPDDNPVPAQSGSAGPAVLTFLIADVRGYTRFTQEHGDEAAGRLAATFAELARTTVVAFDGELIELRGDEALCVFNSARQALRSAVGLQESFRRRTDEGSVFPLPIGIGLDAGEAVPIEGGYRGGALNTAARLCGLAGPGQILATDTVVSLARRLEGIRFVERRSVRVKGLERPVRLIEVVPETPLPPLPEIGAKQRSRWTGRRLGVAAVAAAVLVAVGAAFAVIRAGGTDYLDVVAPNALAEIDTKAAAIASQQTLGSAPSAIATDGKFVWAASEADGTVSRYDPEQRTVQTLSLGGSAGGIAHGEGSVWVTSSHERALVQINPKTGKEVQRIPVGNGPAAVAVGNDAVWVANTIDGTVSRIGLAQGSVTDTISVRSPAGVAVGVGGVWVASEDSGAVVRIDPGSRTIVEAINVGNRPAGVAVGAGSVWVANRQDGTVARIDPATNSLSAAITVGGTPAAIAVDASGVWVAPADEGTITRIDSDTERITDTLTLGSSPSALALADGKLWVATLRPLGGHRGGVLRVEAELSACRCVDPARWAENGNPTDVAVAPLLYDGLVGYRRVAGLAGGRLVANLAARLPTPTDDGRTYSFRLRPGIRYSNGAPVVASDFRSSLERVFAASSETAAPIFGGITGAGRCLSRPGERCDLAQGIEADNGARTITIHLTKADPEFLYKLALPYASVVPAGTPVQAARARPIPGTGPYRVATVDPRREIRLVRNVHFRSWSPDARPVGFPNEIRFHLSDDGESRLAAVERGAADWVSLLDPTLTPERQRGVLTRYADRLHVNPSPTTSWHFLNTRAPPFDDVRVRRALNYAIDRKALVELTGGLFQMTCQILPPSFPGYRPYCPYTLNPNTAGTWTAPDLRKARELVAASGTAGMRVEVVTLDAPRARAVQSYLVTVLRQLGYRGSRRIFPGPEDYFPYVADSRNRAQLGFAGWQADTLAASNFLRPIFTCASFTPRSPANLNLFEYCDPKLDAAMQSATALQASEPARANELWAEVDRRLVDQAVALPWANQPSRVLVSERVGNHQSHPFWGTLLEQLWVK